LLIADTYPVSGLQYCLTEVVISVKILGLKFLRYIAGIRSLGRVRFGSLERTNRVTGKKELLFNNALICDAQPV